MVFKPYLSCFIKEKSYFEIGKNWLSAISLELHQPNMHIGYRVIPLSVHIVSLARSILMVSDPLCCKILFDAELSDDE